MALAMLPDAHLYIQVLGNEITQRLRWFRHLFPDVISKIALVAARLLLRLLGLHTHKHGLCKMYKARRTVATARLIVVIIFHPHDSYPKLYASEDNTIGNPQDNNSQKALVRGADQMPKIRDVKPEQHPNK